MAENKDSLGKEQKKVQKRLVKQDALQAKYGGRRPDLILMSLADNLNRLTKVLIVVTIFVGIVSVLNILTIIFN